MAQPPQSPSAKRAASECSGSSDNASKKAATETCGAKARLAYAAVITSDVKKSAEFFASLLDWKTDHIEPSGMWAEVKASEDNTKLAFHGTKEGHPPGEVRLYFVVPDLDAFHAKISKTPGVVVNKPPTKEPWGGTKAEYTAPDGSKLDALQEWIHDKTEKGAAKSEAKATGEGEKKHSDATNVCWVTIPVGDLARAKKFYTDVFSFAWEKWKPYATLFKAPGDNHHKGHLEVSKERIQYPAIWLNVPDIEPALATIAKHGGQIVEGKQPIDPTCAQVGYKGTFRDTEGNIMLLHASSR